MFVMSLPVLLVFVVLEQYQGEILGDPAWVWGRMKYIISALVQFKVYPVFCLKFLISPLKLKFLCDSDLCVL